MLTWESSTETTTEMHFITVLPAVFSKLPWFFLVFGFQILDNHFSKVYIKVESKNLNITSFLASNLVSTVNSQGRVSPCRTDFLSVSSQWYGNILRESREIGSLALPIGFPVLLWERGSVCTLTGLYCWWLAGIKYKNNKNRLTTVISNSTC